MTEQTGGQTPPGWYPDGSGSIRYWDGSGWTEHVQPATPDPAGEAAAPAGDGTADAAGTDAAATDAGTGASAAAPAAAAGAGGAAGGYAATTTSWDEDPAGGATPFYKKWWGILAIVLVLLLVAGGAIFALTSGDDDSGDTTSPTAAPTPTVAPTTATQTFELTCQPSSFPVAQYSFPLTLTVNQTAPGGPSTIEVSSGASINNTGPTTIEPDKFRFEAAVTVNGTPLQLIGPTNLAEAVGNEDDNAVKPPIFGPAELPLIATGTAPAVAGSTTPPTVVLTDLYFNNINNEPTGTADSTTDTFDARCNLSATPNTSPTPIGLSVPPAAGGTVPTAGATTAPTTAPTAGATTAPTTVPSAAASPVPTS